MDIIEQLEFKYRLNKALRQGRTFDELFAWPDFCQDFQQFIEGRIGQIWMRKKWGWQYVRWQQS